MTNQSFLKQFILPCVSVAKTSFRVKPLLAIDDRVGNPGGTGKRVDLFGQYHAKVRVALLQTDFCGGRIVIQYWSLPAGEKFRDVCLL